MVASTLDHRHSGTAHALLVLLLVAAAALSATAFGRECALPNGQRFSIEIVGCAQFMPGAVDVVSPLERIPAPGGTPATKPTRPAPQSKRPPDGLVHVRGARGACYSINAEGLTHPADPVYCADP